MKEKRESLYTVGQETVTATMKKIMEGPQNLTSELPSDPAIPLLGEHPKK